MKIIVVEDEQKTREGIINIIRQYTEHTIIGEADNGEDGLRLIEELMPDLIITDIQMPDKNGLDMLRELKENNRDISAIILSGFSDFGYACDAIKLGVVEYLLKPITVDDLNECFEKIERQQSKKKSQKLTVEQLLSLLLSSQNVNKENVLQEIQTTLNVNDKTQFTMFLIQPRAIDTETYSQISNLLKMNTEMLCIENCYITKLPFEYGVLLLIVDTEKNHILENSIQNNILPEINNIDSCICTSTRFCQLSQFETEIYRLKSMFIFSLVCEKNQMITEQLISSFNLKHIDYPTDLEIQMKQAICNRDSQKIMDISEDFKDAVLENNCYPKNITEYFVKFLSAICSTIKECREDYKDKIVYHDVIKKVIDTNCKEDLVDIYDGVINIVMSEESINFEIQNLIVLKVINYIRENYAKDISLTQLADMIEVTPEYLSKLFNKEMKINFSAFIKNFRISQAKRLILENKYKIHEIALEVGFKDPKYFNRVFKEVYGGSPSDFKKNVK